MFYTVSGLREGGERLCPGVMRIFSGRNLWEEFYRGPSLRLSNSNYLHKYRLGGVYLKMKCMGIGL